MTKVEFLKELRSKLNGLPEQDIDDRIGFYHEMIADRMAEGKTEEEAVAEIGSVDDVVRDIARETPLRKIVKERCKPKRRIRGWEVALIILGFPLWFPLVVTGFVLALVGYLLTWVLVFVTYSVEMGLIAGIFAGLIGCVLELGTGDMTSMYYLGQAIACLGASMLFIFACIGSTKLSVKISKKMLTGIKAALIRKGN